MGYFQVRYDTRVVNYDHRGFIRLATGLVVMGGDSGRGFESQHHTLKGHFSHILRFFCIDVEITFQEQKTTYPNLLNK